jgi:hypothetical protein
MNQIKPKFLRSKNIIKSILKFLQDKKKKGARKIFLPQSLAIIDENIRLNKTISKEFLHATPR